MRVFMLGWEFPPHISGGLGTACYGMTRGLDEVGVRVCFVLPTAVPPGAPSHVELRSPSDLPPAARARAAAVTGPGDVLTTREFQHLEIRRVDAVLVPYVTPAGYEEAVRRLHRE